MIEPDNINDETLEYAAQLIEETHLSDMQGVFSKRKRAREDANLRFEAGKAVRIDMARHLRAMKSRPELSAINILARIAKRADADKRMDDELRDAWPLAWKGWLNIYAVVRCNSNCVPPETEYRIKITERGRAALAANMDATDTATSGNAPPNSGNYSIGQQV